MEVNKIYHGDVLEVLRTFPDECIDCIVTSPPYFGLRDYGVEGQIGLEPTLNEYLDKMLAVTAELKRVLKKSGTLFWNHGDSYSAKPPGNSIKSQLKISKEGDGVYGRLMSRNRGKNFRFDQYKIRGGGIVEKSLMFQNFRLAQRMCDDDGDDIYELRKCLTQEQRLAILDEIDKYGKYKVSNLRKNNSQRP